MMAVFPAKDIAIELRGLVETTSGCLSSWKLADSVSYIIAKDRTVQKPNVTEWA